MLQLLVVPGDQDRPIVHSELKLGQSYIMAATFKAGAKKAPFCTYTYLGDDDDLDTYLKGLKAKGVPGSG